MISVNGRSFKWSEGLTISKLLELKRYTFSKIIVSINGEFVDPDAYDYTEIQKGDEVKAIHLLAGG